MRFLVDMPLSPGLATWLGEQGYDAVHASELGLNRAPDAEILLRAKQETRTIVTADLDYPRLLAMSGSTEPSVILFRHGDWSDAEVIARMGSLLTTLSESDIQDSIIVIEPERIRRRRLPLKPPD